MQRGRNGWPAAQGPAGPPFSGPAMNHHGLHLFTAGWTRGSAFLTNTGIHQWMRRKMSLYTPKYTREFYSNNITSFARKRIELENVKPNKPKSRVAFLSSYMRTREKKEKLWGIS